MPVEIPHALRATSTAAMTAVMGLSGMGEGDASCSGVTKNPAKNISPANSSVTALPRIESTALARIPIGPPYGSKGSRRRGLPRQWSFPVVTNLEKEMTRSAIQVVLSMQGFG